MTTAYFKKDYTEESGMVYILLCCLLFKLGGSVTMTLGDIHKIFAEFPKVRLALQRTDKTGLQLKPEHELLTVTLRSQHMIEENNLLGLL